MMNSLQRKIETMRFIMITTAEKHSNDLLHPEVIRVSRELDQLIVQAMKSRSRPSSLAVAERASYVS
ncbi:aspartyl-phosphate phosphatase Spo0E family protein [Paenibacillus sp.]|uniref:aspartyl-phosphate phosphatase Spo0E family protein n=1 Tax=Paenibacillus sp. TaxID=58172 RepID=UPI0028127AD5|nr:aspartyl-phosphate phosphatase Spo0E family protein [Paenibacillus sp.]